MDSNQIFQNLMKFLIGSGIIGLVIRSIVKLVIEKDFEKYKYKLQKEHLKQSRLHDKRALIIKKLYEKLIELEAKIKEYISPGKYDYERFDKKLQLEIENLGGDIKEYFRYNRIYFSSKTCNLIEVINSKFKILWDNIRTFEEFEYRGEENIKYHDSKIIKDCWNMIRTDIPLLRESLENEFREILGVD